MYKNFENLILLKGGASEKKIYRCNKKNKNFIILDFSQNKVEFNNHLIVYNILKNINISIPSIYEIDFKNYTIVTEDFGNQRYDKIIDKYQINFLLECAIESLIIINNSSINQYGFESLPQYNYQIFKNEISELVDYFCPYKKIDSSINKAFFEIWKKYYKKLDFEFNTFVHKDFELTNLIYLPKKNSHLRCGILDFQSAFVGFKGWDLFSLLENSRIYFSTKKNEQFLRKYYNQTYRKIDFDSFKKQYYFLNTSRQTRLLGRWVKFAKVDKNKSYLKFIDTTIKRLKNSLQSLEIRELNGIYERILN